MDLEAWELGRRLGPLAEAAHHRRKSYSEPLFESRILTYHTGPYRGSIHTHLQNLYTADHILLIVDGTGITGALSIADWWAFHYGSELPAQKSLRPIWTVRNRRCADLQEISRLRALVDASSNMDFRIHVSEESGRLGCDAELAHFLSLSEERVGRAWVYASGPESMVTSVETACIVQAILMGRMTATNVSALTWYAAKWTGLEIRGEVVANYRILVDSLRRV